MNGPGNSASVNAKPQGGSQSGFRSVTMAGNPGQHPVRFNFEGDNTTWINDVAIRCDNGDWPPPP